MRTSLACVSAVVASVAAALSTYRLNVRGSLRRDATSVPPRTGPWPPCCGGGADERQADVAPRISANIAGNRAARKGARQARATLELTGQLLGLSPSSVFLEFLRVGPADGRRTLQAANPLASRAENPLRWRVPSYSKLWRTATIMNHRVIWCSMP